MSAKNKANLTAFIGTTYYRKAGTTGQLKELASARGTVYEADISNVVDVNSDTRGTALKGVIPISSISLTFLENANSNTFADLLGEDVAINVGGTVAIPEKTITLASDDTYSFTELSSDGLGVTSIVVKDAATGLVTYVLDTDYSVSIVDDFTVITRIGTGAITEGEELIVSGSVEANANEKVTSESSLRIVDELEIVIKAKIKNDAGETKFRTITGTPATLNSTYQMEFIDFVKNGDIAGASVKFDISEGGSVKYVNEHLTA